MSSFVGTYSGVQSEQVPVVLALCPHRPRTSSKQYMYLYPKEKGENVTLVYNSSMNRHNVKLY